MRPRARRSPVRRSYRYIEGVTSSTVQRVSAFAWEVLGDLEAASPAGIPPDALSKAATRVELQEGTILQGWLDTQGDKLR